MSIQDFLEEAKRRTNGERLSPVQEEVHEFALMVYRGIKRGNTERWVKEVARMLVQNIAPTLPPVDALKAAVSIEGIALTVLSDLFSEGTLTKIKRR